MPPPAMDFCAQAVQTSNVFPPEKHATQLTTVQMERMKLTIYAVIITRNHYLESFMIK